ncbi:MAG: sensor histidine kinase [Acetobacteraceae bacterium]|nr:sensor histidine kinase [Acetobacteraceae bacterium]
MPRLHSLRARLILIPTAILLAGLIASIAAIVTGARGRVQAEAQSGMRLGEQLLVDALQDVGQSADPERAYAALIADLPRVRHVTFTPSNAASMQEAPGFLTWALAPTSLTQTFPVEGGGRRIAAITMRSNPADEIGEVRAELLTVTVLLTVVWASTIILLRIAVTRGLRPLSILADAFDRLEHGEASVAVPPIATAELKRLGAQFNKLSEKLAEAHADNRHLIERLMSAQEAERQELARELHDEIGPLLFGIRADAACIQRWSAEGKVAGIPARVRSLAQHADGLQRINSRILERMRPLVLEELGLTEALRALLASWRARLPDIAWTLAVPDRLLDPDPASALTVFRIAGEALTNAARHADATHVEVALRSEAGALTVVVRDNGRGLPEEARSVRERRGYGLLGMNERARQSGGTFRACRAGGGGTVVEATLPVSEAVCESC